MEKGHCVHNLGTKYREKSFMFVKKKNNINNAVKTKNFSVSTSLKLFHKDVS